MNQLTFTNPQWLWLIAPAGVLILLISRRSAVNMSHAGRVSGILLRLTAVILIALAMAGPGVPLIRYEVPAACNIILQDTSQSVQADPVGSQAAAQIAKSLSPDLPLRQYRFAGQALPGTAGPADSSQTDIEAALDAVYRDTADTPAAHVILVTDGRQTRGVAERAARRLALRGGVVHVVPTGRALATPPRLLRIDPGIQNHVGLPITFTISVESVQSQRLQVRLLDALDHILDQRDLVVQGKRCLVLQHTPQAGGLTNYRVEIMTPPAQGSRQPLLADSEQAAVQVEGPPRVLFLDPFPDELQPLKGAVVPLKLDIEAADPASFRGDLTSYAAVILSDFSGRELSSDQRGALTRYVEAGGGLVFIGGGNCMPQRWMNHSLAALLPFTIQEKKRPVAEEKPKISICYVLDRSGSMQAPLGAGANKLDIVKASVHASLRDLPDTAMVSIIVFDDQFDMVVPPTPLSKRDEIEQKLDTVVIGGGTNMGPAIGKAMDTLATTAADKYIVVLTDGQTNAPPTGGWDPYTREATARKIHWTSIAIGPDADVTLMKGLANATGGTYYFCPAGDQIPKVFIAQARTVRRKAEDTDLPFRPVPGPAVNQLKSITAANIPELKSSLSTSTRPGTDIILLGRDRQPLLAAWHYGLGMVVAFGSDAKGVWSEKWMPWQDFPAFWSQIVQKCLRVPSPLHAKVQTLDTADGLTVVFTVTDDHGNPAANLSCEGKVSAFGQSASSTTDSPHLTWSSHSPGVYETSLVVPEGSGSQLLRSQMVDAKGSVIPYAAVIRGHRATELAATGPDFPALQSLAAAGNGLCSTDIRQISAACVPPTPREFMRMHSLIPYLAALAIAVWILDVLLRKLLCLC